MSQPQNAPLLVREWAESLKQSTGATAVLTKPQYDWWTITLANERVTLELFFRITGGGNRWVMKGSTLAIDGKQEQLCQSYDHFVRVFADPDVELAIRHLPLPEITDPIDYQDVTTAPSEIAEAHRALHQVFADRRRADHETRVGRIGESFWAVEIHSDSLGETARFYFRRGYGPWTLDLKEFQVAGRTGEVTEQLRTALDRVTAFLHREPGEQHSTGPTITHTSQASVNTAVDVRKQSVMRI